MHVNRARLDRRAGILALLLAGLLGTGLMSLAAVTDSLNVQNNYEALSVNIQASANGTAAADSITFDWLIEHNDLPTRKPVFFHNVGNGSASITFSGTGTNTGTAEFARILNSAFSVYTMVTGGTAGDCAAGVNIGPDLATATSTVGSAASATSLTLAPDAVVLLCMEIDPSLAVQPNDAATQTVTFTSTSAL